MRTMLKRVSMVGRCSLAGLLAFGLAAESRATISYSGGTYSQNFDTLANTGSPAWANDATLPGWSLFRQPAATPVAIGSYLAGAGSSTAGGFYSFGAVSTTERALGGLGSGGDVFGSPGGGAVAGWIAVALLNSSGIAYSSFALDYTGEQWRNGGNTAAQTMVLEYGFGATFASVGNGWTAGGAGFNFTSLINTATAGVLDGNASANRTTGRGGTITPNVAWNAGDTLWIRWIENNDAGNDHGLAIDDLTFSATAVPEASTWVTGLGLSLGMLGTFVRKYRK